MGLIQSLNTTCKLFNHLYAVSNKAHYKWVIHMDKSIIGKRIRREREKLSLTREEFAERVNISPQFLAQLENATRGMSAETLYKMCVEFNISADYILLGRLTTEGLHAPGAALLSKIPTLYTEAIEDILRAFITTIDIATDKSTN